MQSHNCFSDYFHQRKLIPRAELKIDLKTRMVGQRDVVRSAAFHVCRFNNMQQNHILVLKFVSIGIGLIKKKIVSNATEDQKFIQRFSLQQVHSKGFSLIMKAI